MKIRKKLVVLLMLVFFGIGILISPLLIDDYYLSREARNLQFLLSKNPSFSALHVSSSSVKFRRLIVEGRVSSYEEFKLLERHLRAHQGFDIYLNVIVNGASRSMYIQNTTRKNTSVDTSDDGPPER